MIAEFELVAHAREPGDAAARIAVKPRLDETGAALVVMQRVIQAQPEVDLVVEAVAAHALPVGVIRKAVDVDVEIESLVGLAELARPARRGATTRRSRLFGNAHNLSSD
ncbi:MAG: hypothetical protein ABI423_00150 [Burkholderiales bacterium]